jgi:hypothetical protein
MAAAWSLHHYQPQQHGQAVSPEQQLADPQLWRQCSPDSLLLAVEGGVLQRADGGLYCFAWVAAQLAGGGACHRCQAQLSPPQAAPSFVSWRLADSLLWLICCVQARSALPAQRSSCCPAVWQSLCLVAWS